MKRLLAALAILVPSLAQAGVFCDEPRPTEMPACMVGVWAGDNDMLEKMRAIMANMPASVRANMEAEMGRPLGMTIYEDGYYATLAVRRGLIAEIQGGGDGSTQINMDLSITPARGWLSAGEKGELGFCSEPGTGQFMMTTTTSGPGGSQSSTQVPTGRDDYVPEMSYECAGDQMIMRAYLPDPVGTVTYTLHRVAKSRWSKEFEDAYQRRFATE